MFAMQAAWAQVTFFADPKYLNPQGSAWDKAQLTEQEWRIEGRRLHWGETIVVPVDAGMDTVFYLNRAGAKWDTIFCNISAPDSFAFDYNECCGGFYVRRVGQKGFLQGKLQADVRAPQRKKTYLATIDEAGMVLEDGKSGIIRPMCRSAMAPSVYKIELQEIASCSGDSCAYTVCQFEFGVAEPSYDFTFTPVKSLVSILWMPLSDPILELRYEAGNCRLRTREE